MRGEFRALKLERRKLGIDRLVELLRRLEARRGKLGGRGDVELVGSVRRRFQFFQLIGAGIDQRHIRRIFGGERGKPIDRRRIFARGGAQREQPLLDALELGGIEIGGKQRRGKMLIGLLQRVDRDIDRLHRGLDESRRIGRPPFEPPHRRREAGYRRLIATDGVLRLAQVGGDLLALHHGGAAGGQRRFLAVLWRELFQFIGGVPQIIGLARGALHAGAVVVEQTIGLAPRLPELFQRCDFLLEAGERVEQAAMGRGIDQRALVMLAVNLDQRSAQRFQGLHADGLIVDEGAGAAVGELHPPQDHLAES